MEKLRLITSRNAIKALPVLAGVMLFAGIFAAYALAASPEPTGRAFDTTAASMAELNKQQADEVETPVTQTDDQTGQTSNSTTVVTQPQPQTAAAPASKPVAAANDKDVANSLPDPNRNYYDGLGNLYDYTGRLLQAATQPLADTLNCQYPLRPLVNGSCDNSDPCDPSTLKDLDLLGACRN